TLASSSLSLSLHDALPILLEIGIILHLIYDQMFDISMIPDPAESVLQIQKRIHILVGQQPLFLGYIRKHGIAVFFQKFIIDLIRSEEHTSELQSRFDLVCR